MRGKEKEVYLFKIKDVYMIEMKVGLARGFN